MRQRADIINRTGEQRFLTRFFKENLGKRRALVLHSPSGFGKSYLVDYVLAQTEGNYSYVVIGRTTKYDGVTYIQQLAGALNDSAEETGRFPTFSQYRDILRSENSDLALQLAQETIEPIGAAISGVPKLESVTSVTKAVRAIFSYFMASDIAIDDIIKSSSNDAVVLCEKYARYLAPRNLIVLRINKYNEIDNQSDFYLRNIYGSSEKIILVLEITNPDQNGDDFASRIDIDNRFLGNVEYKKLEKVEIRHITERYGDIVKPEDPEMAKFVEQAFISAQGNFRQFDLLIRDAVSRPLYKAYLSSEEHISAAMNAMPRNCKRLLALACALPSRLEIQILEAIWKQNNWSADGNLSVALDKLQSYYEALISFDKGVLELIDDPVRGYLLTSQALTLFNIEARNALLSALRRENLASASPDKLYLNTISIISLIIQGQGGGDSSLLLTSLDELDLLRYPSNKTELVDAVKKLFYEYVYRCREAETNSSAISIYDRTYEEICKILYTIGDMEAVDKIASSYSRFFPLEVHPTFLRLTLISAKILLGRKDAVKLIEAINRQDKVLYFGSRLLLISYYRTFDLTRRAKHEWRKLKRENEIAGSVFEGLFYEYGALTTPLNLWNRLRLLKRAKRCYETKGNQYHTVSCGLGISSTYLYLPIFAAWKSWFARRELKALSGSLADVRIMDHVLENQLAAIEMHRGNWNEQVVENLKYAYNRCILAPDKLLIGANLIVCFLELRRTSAETESIEVYVNDILSINRVYQNRSSELARYALAACYRYFQAMDDRPMIRNLREEDLSKMTIQFSAFNLGQPGTAASRFFVKYIYSKIYVRFWPKILPVYNWSIDFYSFREN